MKWETIVPILVALIGIASALVTGYVAGRRQVQTEYKRETRLAVAELARSLGIAAHTITWFT